MKYLWLDVLLAFFIWQMSTYIYTNTTPNAYLIKELNAFNEDVENSRILKDYHVSKETNPNLISEIVDDLSEISRTTIKTSVEIVVSLVSGFN